MREVVIVGKARTAIGRFQGALSAQTAPQLGAVAIAGALKNAAVSTEDVDEVIMGEVLSAGVGQAPARQAALYAGLPTKTPCMTINKVCGSGLKAVMLADQAIRCEDAKVVIAGGMENMSLTPYYLTDSRDGMRLGHKKVLDSINQYKYIFQRALSKEKLNIKYIPKIKFYLDDTFDEAQKIEKLLLNKNVLRDLK